MELVEFVADDLDRVDAYVALARACDELDCPWEAPRSRFRLQAEMRYGWDGEVARYFLVVDGTTAVGTMTLYAPEQENQDLAWVEVRIHPAYRRRGLGTAAVRAAEGCALAAGRPLVILESGLDTPEVRAFADRLGYPPSQVTVRRVQELQGTAEEKERWESLRAEAAAYSPAYDLVRVQGSTPENLLDGLVAATAAINDAPIDDLEYEDEVYDADRIRRFEQAQADAGCRLYRVLAVERETGAVAGHTVVTVYSEAPASCEQDDTTVLAAHRGHRLGLRLKADMLCWLAEAEPQVRSVLTQNAESNGPMIAVNELLGYRIAGRHVLFQRRLGA